MKTKAYFTCGGNAFLSKCEFSEREIFKSSPLPGVKRMKRAENGITNDFLKFAVAITGSSCYLLSKMSQEERTAFLQNIYGDEGLRLRVARLSVAASDYSAEIYSYDDTEGDTVLKDFSVERDKAYIIPMLKEIVKINPELYLFASPWSPPA